MDSGTKIALVILVLVIIAGLDVAAIWTVRKRWGNRRKVLAQRLHSIAMHRRGVEELPTLAKKTARTGWLIDLVRRTPALDFLQSLLMRSGSDQAAEHVFSVVVAFALGLGLITALVSGSWLLGMLFVLLVIAGTVMRLSYRAAKRERAFTEQLPDALDFMSRALRAGHSLSVAIGMVADELPEPISGEFRTVFEEVNFGISFQDSLSKMPQRIESSDLNFFVVAVLIQRETGGNLSDLLHSLANTVRERIKLHGRVRVLSAEGKYSGVLLGILPFLMAGALSLINPKYMQVLWTTPIGHTLVTTSLIALTIGFVWMWQLTKIKV